ncbi:heterokaryon incompatibility protein-domain-containing protein, partial [Cercophora newfieldiana]
MQPHVNALIHEFIEIACRAPAAASQQQQQQQAAIQAVAQGNFLINPTRPLYANRALQRSQRNIRVLVLHPGSTSEIECDLVVADLQDPKGYDAISYVWGPPTPTHPVTVNGTKLDIGHSLHVALTAFRLPDQPRRLWADAICIDQQNNEEKSWQVEMMADIYRHAQTVRVFLGDEGSTAPLFRFLERHVPNDSICDVEKDAARLGLQAIDLLSAYVDFSLRPWFSRVWVYQE